MKMFENIKLKCERLSILFDLNFQYHKFKKEYKFYDLYTFINMLKNDIKTNNLQLKEFHISNLHCLIDLLPKTNSKHNNKYNELSLNIRQLKYNIKHKYQINEIEKLFFINELNKLLIKIKHKK